MSELSQMWSLRVGPPFQPGGQTAWVAPAVDADGRELVLKVGWRHPEADQEADGLRVWAGRGAVQLYAAEKLDQTIGLLLERCTPGTPLSLRPEDEQDQIVARLLPNLWLEAPVGEAFRPLQVMCDQWADEFEAKLATAAGTLDSGLVRVGIELFRSLPASADRNVLLCTDLHAGNVLAAQRQPWLVIDPKPYVGDPTYDPLQHLLNCEQRLHANPRALIARVADLLELDRERLTLWLFARCVQESLDWPQLGHVARQLAPG
ncbi:MAG: aminoglycoside phosphotransferase family protein [Actinomycetota bacterium]|nr:aminoglycoside phosphotransferase family protein [Actinomycetota bacterium]